MSHYQASLVKERPVTNSDKRAGEAAKKLHSMVQSLCIAAVSAESETQVHTLIILSQAANGLLHLLARSVMPLDDGNSPISSTATLFAALMAYHVGPCEVEVGKVAAEYSPLIIFDALKDTEKLSGQRPDEHLSEVMCRVARECAADPAMVARINMCRSALHKSGETLN